MPFTIRILGHAALALLLGGCGAEDEQAASGTFPAAAVRPVKTVRVGGGEADALRNFPGRIEASRRAEMSFRVAGTVTDILVREGDNVAEGAVLARLDPTDFNIVLRDRQASYDNAKRNFERARELLPAGNISKLDYDRTEASYKSAEAALSQARQDLAYTDLRAPFAGSVAKRLVQRFEEVSAREPVISLQTINSLDVKIDLPERLVRSLTVKQEAGVEHAGDEADAWAEFEGTPGKRFPLVVKEVATKADARTQTFEVTFSMPNPTDVVVLPGMTATVSVDFSGMMAAHASVWVPASAVLADAELAPLVWVLDPVSMTVAKRRVRVGSMQDSRIQILEGLDDGEEIVSVGASFMADGVKVARMAATEQAMPRADDPQ